MAACCRPGRRYGGVLQSNPTFQAYEEFDEEVQEAEELEERALAGGVAQADRDDEIKPYIHK